MLPLPGMESEALTPFSPSLQISALLEGEKNNEKTRHKCRHPFGTIAWHGAFQIADTVQLFANGKNV